jgi:hypothetical protein
MKTYSLALASTFNAGSSAAAVPGRPRPEAGEGRNARTRLSEQPITADVQYGYRNGTIDPIVDLTYSTLRGSRNFSLAGGRRQSQSIAFRFALRRPS